MRLIQISLLVAVLSGACWSQGSDITLNFVVRDKKGTPVKTLGVADFEFTDDGAAAKPKVVLYDGAEMVEGGQRKASEPIRRIRLIPIVLEVLSSEQRRLAKQIANDLIKEDKDPSHLFAVFKISNQASLLQPFTSNRDELRKAIDVATSGVGNLRFAEINKEAVAKLKTAATNAQAISEEDVTAAKIMTSPALQGLLARTQLAMLSDAIIDDQEGTRRSIILLDAMIAGLKSIPGRKPLAYLNAGFTLPTNLDAAFEAMLARANMAGVSLYPIDTRGITTASQGAAVKDAISANLANTEAGLENRDVGDNTNRIGNAVEGLRGNVQAKLITMAESTSGVMAVESNDPRRQLRELIADTQTYYEAKYDPGNSDYSGAFRKTSIKVKQADARVHSRDGYLAMPPGEENLLPFEIPLFKALRTTPIVRDVEFRSGAWKLKSTKERIQGMVAIEVPFANLAFAQDEAKGLYAARISMVTLVRNAEGNVVEKFTRDLPLKGSLSQLEALKGSNFNFRERFSVPPGRYVVEAAVIDQLSRKVGARKTTFVAAANNSPLGMSSVTVVRSFQPGVKDLSVEEPFQFQGGRITPTLNNTIQVVKGAQMALFFTVYPEGGTVAPQALVQYLKDGVLAGSANLPLPAVDAQGRIQYVLSSPLDAMPAGNYEVKVIIKQGSAAVAESVFLTVGA
jgi:VWFA-related protein